MTGIELIAKERQEQIEKHGRTIESDMVENTSFQLPMAAAKLLHHPAEVKEPYEPPKNWDVRIWGKMTGKPYLERLVIAGALIAAEIDRIQAHK